MRIRAFAMLCSVLAVLPMPVRADVSVTQQVQTSGFMSIVSSTTRMLRMKGLKLRLEIKAGSMLPVTIIYDLENGKRYRLDPQHRRVFVMDLKAVGERDLQHVAVDGVKREVRATGNKKEIMGITCDEFAFDLQAPSAGLLHDSGTVCLTTANPAGSEIVNFVNEAKKRGYLRAAALWSPTSSFSTIGPFFYAGDQNILIVSAKTESWEEKGARLGLTTTLTELSLGPISDEVFRIPSDWKFREDPEGR